MISKYKYAILSALIFGAGFVANGYRWQAKYQALEVATLQQDGKRKDANMAAVLKNQQHVLGAIQNWQYANQRNEKAYEELNQTVISMRSTVSGLRGDFSTLPGFLRDASKETVGQYAAACTAIFADMAAAGGEMARAGAELARKADGHAADAALIAK